LSCSIRHMPKHTKSLTIVSLCLLCTTAAAQMKVHKCTDTDGKELMVTEYYGSAVTDIEISRGKTVFYSKSFYHTDLLDTVCLLPKYQGNKCVTDILFYNAPNTGAADESLHWLSGVTNSKRYITPLGKTFTASFELKAVTNLRLPLLPYQRPLTEGCQLLYSPHNYGNSIRQVDSLNNYTLYLANNAVLLNREDAFYWLYISDGSVTDGTQRLRDQAIVSARFINNKVVIERQNNNISDAVSVVVIDYEKGTLISYNLDRGNNYYIAYSWNENTPDVLQLVLNNNTTQTISLKD